MRYIEIPYKNIIIQGTIFGTIEPRVVCIHGATEQGSAYFDSLRNHLAKVGIASLAFDFIGAGVTGGTMRNSCLKDRFEQACAVIDATPHQKPLAIIGASMGADTAIRLAETYPTSALVLFVPGIYSERAYEASFTEEFTKILREAESWKNSASFDILSRFTGSLLVIGAGSDEVVSREILEQIIDSAVLVKHKELFIVPHSTHAILSSYLLEHQKEFARVFEKVYHAILE